MTTTEERSTLRARRGATVREHIDAENAHDADAAVATFSRTKAAYDIPAFGEAGQVPGHAAVRRALGRPSPTSTPNPGPSDTGTTMCSSMSG